MAAIFVVTTNLDMCNVLCFSISFSFSCFFLGRILQLCPDHCTCKEGMYMQARKCRGKEVFERLQEMEKTSPMELLGHLENFAQTFLGR